LVAPVVFGQSATPALRHFFVRGCYVELEEIVSECFVVEAGRKVIGVAVRFSGGFRFFSSDSAYRELENRTFRHARTIAPTGTQLRCSK
jgi:hypothetical protein